MSDRSSSDKNGPAPSDIDKSVSKSGVDSSEFDIDAFAQWIKVHAEANGMSQQDLADELVSSYWLFKELNEAVISGSGNIAGVLSSSLELTLGQSSTSEEISSAGDFQQTVASETEDNSGEGREPKNETDRDIESATELTPSIIVNKKQENPELELSDEENRGSIEKSPETSQSMDETFIHLLYQFKQLLTNLEEIKSEQNEFSDDVLDCLIELNDRLEEHEEQLDRTIKISDLEETTVQNMQEIDATRDQMKTIEQEVQQLRSSQEEVDSWIENEFDTIQAVFDRFLEDIDELRMNLDGLREAYRNDMQRIQERANKQDQLSKLKQEAVRLGEEEGCCDACDELVDLSVLATPHCPSCDRVFTDIQKSGWIPFTSPVLETEPIQVGSMENTREGKSDLSEFQDASDREENRSENNKDKL